LFLKVSECCMPNSLRVWNSWFSAFLAGFIDTYFQQELEVVCRQPFLLTFFFCAAAQLGPLLPHSSGFQITHNDTPQSVGLLWTNDLLVAETSTWQHTTLTSEKHPYPAAGFEPTISAGERPQTYVLDRAATGTRLFKITNQFVQRLLS